MVQVLVDKDLFFLGICHYGNGKIKVKLCLTAPVNCKYFSIMELESV